MPKPRLAPIEQLAPGWRTAPLSPRQVAALRTLHDEESEADARVLLSLWRLGLVARVFREHVRGWAPDSWTLTERGRIRLDEEPCVRAF